MATFSLTSKTDNLILDSLDPAERADLLAGAEPRALEVGHVFLSPGDQITEVIFPRSGTVSVVTEPRTGQRVEAATVGREGVGSVHSALGSRVAGQELVGQVSGEAIAVDVDRFAKLSSHPGKLQDLIHGYLEAFFAQASLSAACNAVHNLNERCARWLLLTHDRVDSDTFDLKQEFLAVMLGVQRPSVSISAGTLQEAGLITYRRGSITILDREGLEDATCPCYEMIRSEYSRLVPLTSGQFQGDDRSWES
jgi:CRP-like cAMP-binding protein